MVSFLPFWQNENCKTLVLEECEFSGKVTQDQQAILCAEADIMKQTNKKLVLSLPIDILDKQNGIHHHRWLFYRCQTIFLRFVANMDVSRYLKHLTSLISRSTFPHLQVLHVQVEWGTLYVGPDKAIQQTIMDRIVSWIKKYWYQIHKNNQWESCTIGVVSQWAQFHVDVTQMQTFNGITTKKLDFLKYVASHEFQPQSCKYVTAWDDFTNVWTKLD